MGVAQRHHRWQAAQVIGKFGDDSDEAQAVGLTKKSERAKPKRKKTGGNTPIKPG